VMPLLLLSLLVAPSLQMATYPADLLPEFYRELGGVISSQMELPSVPSPIEEGHWPRRDLEIGQVGGVAVDLSDRPQIFHRGNVTWDAKSFNRSHHYQRRGEGAIPGPTLLTLDRVTGAVLKAEGVGRYYMPHGLSIDSKGNRWITDVALHQVFKLPPDSDTPSLTLGVAFEPGSDSAHFCQPADVAVTDDGTVFVADGYCNKRVAVFNDKGRYLGSFGEREGIAFAVPHSLTVQGDVLCVADRENSRLICWDVHQPYVEPQVTNLSLYGRVFAVAAAGDVLFTVHQSESGAGGLTLDLATGTVLDSWSAAKGFYTPHDLAVSSDGRTIYVAETTPARLYKFLVEPNFYQEV